MEKLKMNGLQIEQVENDTARNQQDSVSDHFEEAPIPMIQTNGIYNKT